jgi:transposase, IS605 OrfB family, central region
MMNKTIKIPISSNSNFLKDQASRYAQVFNHVISFGLDNEIYNGVELHHKTYYTFANNKGFLPSQLIVSARTKATETIRGWLTAKKKRDKQILKQQEMIAKGKHIKRLLQPITRPISKGVLAVRYDARSFNIDFKTKTISFSSINSRQHITFNSNPYYAQYFTGKVCSADLCWHKKNKLFFFHVVLEFKDPISPEPLKVLGVDLGLNNLAVSSDGKFYMKHSVRGHVSKIQGLKSRLQGKGTPSAIRHLKAVSGREHRFRRDVNHCVTKQIVTQAKALGYDTIAIEDLKDIRQQTRRNKKAFIKRLNSWPFDQFREFLTYKALASGIGLSVVDSRYTSQRCSRCGHVYEPQRKGNEFHCVACGYQNHADLNASYNISKNCLSEVQLKETPRSGRQACSDRAEDQPAYCGGTAAAMPALA